MPRGTNAPVAKTSSSHMHQTKPRIDRQGSRTEAAKTHQLRAMYRSKPGRIGLLSDPRVYPYEYVSKRRRLSIHALPFFIKSDRQLYV